MKETEMNARALMDLTSDELLSELSYVENMNKFYYARKNEIMKEIERRTENGRND